MPSAVASSAFMSTTADAPSVRGDELPAVTEPCLRSKAGRSLASLSSEESVRTPSSRSMTFSYSGGTYTGVISAVSRPSCVPAAASSCERRAHASWSSREIPFSFAMRSADSPIVSPVVGSAIAGLTGMRSLGRTDENGERRCPNVFPLAATTSVFESLSVTVIGMCDNDSDPPATTTSA